MNEPKRRGRPPKVQTLEATVMREWKRIAEGGEIAQHVAPADAAQAYAQRVWDGQSDTVTRKERLERVAKALEGQGLSMEGVSL